MDAATLENRLQKMCSRLRQTLETRHPPESGVLRSPSRPDGFGLEVKLSVKDFIKWKRARGKLTGDDDGKSLWRAEKDEKRKSGMKCRTRLTFHNSYSGAYNPINRCKIPPITSPSALRVQMKLNCDTRFEIEMLTQVRLRDATLLSTLIGNL